MTSDSIRPPEKRYGYRNAVVGVINLFQEERLQGLGRGLGPNTVRGTFLSYIQLLVDYLPIVACNADECLVLCFALVQ